MNPGTLRPLSLTACLALAACQGSGVPTNFDDGTWIFNPDRVWTAPEGGIAAPTDALDEADYSPSDTEPDWSVRVSAHGKSLELTVESADLTTINGTGGDAVGDRLHYDLTEGAFAGGRFEVWDDGSLQAELTLFGSGVPIVSSQRGDVVQEFGL